jgi:putative addiction module component (TIGR02574 family)
VEAVLDGIANQGDEPDLTDELKAEFDRRIAELDRNPDAGVIWEEVKARVLDGLRK